MICSNTNLVLTGSSGGTVGLWNSNKGKNVGMLLCGSAEEEGVECVQVSDTGHDVYTGNLGGVAAMWDISTQVTKWGVAVGGAVTQLALGEGVVYCGTEEGVVRGVDSRTGGAVLELTGHKGAVLDLVIVGDNMVTASDDGTARVWDLRVNS